MTASHTLDSVVPSAASPTARLGPRWIGRAIMGVGAFHTAFGVWWFAEPLGRMAGAGLWSSVGWSDAGRALAFWFVVAGALAMLLGALTDWIERPAGMPLPRFLGWALLALTALGCLCLPVSAFWVLLAPAVGAIVGGARRGAAADSRG
jgi:hypothetical protein